MISEIFILTDGSEVLVRKMFGRDKKSCSAVKAFCKKLQDVNAGRIPPHFVEEGLHFCYIHPGNLYFVAASVDNMVPIVVIEFLTKVFHMLKDYVGLVTETSVRANTLLAFEILAEVMDGGYVQVASTEQLQPFILSQAVATANSVSKPEEVASRIFGINNRASPAVPTQNPMAFTALSSGQLYVDAREDLTAVVSATGEISYLKVEGAVLISGNITGYTRIKIGLNEDLQIVNPGQDGAFGGSVKLSHYKLHQNADPVQFERKRVLQISPTAGEYSAITYIVEPSSVKLPIEIKTKISEIPASRDVSLTIKVSLDYTTMPPPACALRLNIMLPVPSNVSSMSQAVTGSSESLELNKGHIKWTVGKLSADEGSVAVLRLISHSGQTINTREIGPVTAHFELSNVVLSGLKVGYIKVLEGSKRKPVERFLRWRTTSTSFTVLTT